MSNNETRPATNKSLWAGLIVLTVGVVLLLHGMDLIFFPWWLFRWPMILIIIGLIIGIKSNFENGAWLVLMLIGGLFLLNEINLFGRHLWNYGPAIAVIVLGVFLIFRSLSRNSDTRHHGWHYPNDRRTTSLGPDQPSANSEKSSFSSVDGEDMIDMVNVFGGTKRKVFSKHFRGGETVNFFGGTHLDLTQADLENNTAAIEIVCVFGGVQLIVPSNWSIESRITTILGGLEDKRPPVTSDPAGKRLVLTGVCVFGGVEIKSFY